MDLSFGDIITGVSFAGTVLVLLLSTRFVSKTDYKEDQEKREKVSQEDLNRREKMDARLAEVEKTQALAAQPLEDMRRSLNNIDIKMDRFLEAHQDMESRLVRLEAERDAKARMRDSRPQV